MDITPKPSSASELQSGRQTAINTTVIPNIEDLKLENEKLYKAKVIQVLSDIETTETIDNKSKLPNQNTKEWLLKINGKLAKVASEIPMTVGQSLTIKLDSSATQRTNTLLIVNTTTPTNTGDTFAHNSQVLLNSLSKLLPKQLSLSTGFAALSQLYKSFPANPLTSPQLTTTQSGNANTAPSNQAKAFPPTSEKALTKGTGGNEPNVIKNILDGLLQSLPKLEKTTSPGQMMQPLPSIQQHLKSTGLFFESSLSTPEARDKLLHQLKQLQSTNLDATPKHNQVSTHNSHQTGKQTSGSSSGANTLRSGQSASMHALNLLQQFVKQSSDKATPNTTDTSPPLPSDLKARLLALSRLIETPQVDEASRIRQLDTLMGSVVEPELLSTPFNFPRVQSETAAKAKALFADQEFSTGQLLKILAGMLNRIQFNQLNSLYQSQNTEGNAVQSWFFELPVVGTGQEVNSFNIRVDKEKKGAKSQDQDNDEQALQWKLSLSFDLEELGAMYIQVSLTPPSISSVIWADQEETFELAKAEISHFEAKLKDLGLEVGDIHCQKGLPPQQATKLSQSLVDVQA